MPRGENREALLQAGRELLHRQGYEATGVGEVTRTAGVPKGSFYNYFDSKEAFAIEVLREYTDSSRLRVRAQLDQGDGPYLVRLRRLYESWIEGFREGGFVRGCLAGSMCQEMGGRVPGFQEALEGTCCEMRSAIAACLVRAQDAGELPPSHDVDRLARFLFDAWQGAIIRMKVERSDRPLQDFIELVFGRLLT